MSGSATGTATPVADPRAALWACVAAGFATLLDAVVIAFTAPAVSATFGGSTAGVQWLLASFSLTFGLGLIPSGRLGDVYGRRRLFTIGLCVFGVGGMVAVTAPGLGVLVAARFVQGFGAGIISAQVLGAIQDAFHGAARVRVLGAYTAAGALAGLAGPLVAALAISSASPDISWRVVLALPLPFVAGAVVLGARGLSGAPPRGAEAAPRARRGFDLPGILALCAIVVGATVPVVEPGLSPGQIVAVLAAVGVLIASLWAWERRYAKAGRMPLFAPELVRSPGFVLGNIVALVWFGSGMAFGTAVTVFLLQQPGVSPVAVALLFALGSAARLVSSLASRWVLVGSGSAGVVGGLVLQALAFAAVAFAAPIAGAGSLLVVLGAAEVALGLSSGIIEPGLRAVTLSFAHREVHGVAASFLQLTQRLSATFFVALAAGILLGDSGVATANSLHTALLVCSVASAAAVAVATAPVLQAAGRSAIA